MFPLSSQAARPEVAPLWRSDPIVWGMCIRRTMSYLAIEASATDSTPASDSTPAPNVAPKARRWRAEGAPSRSAEGALSKWPWVPKARMRGGAQGATIARPEICTVRSKHEFIGDGRNQLNNNKLKGLMAYSQTYRRWLITVRAMDIVSLCF